MVKYLVIILIFITVLISPFIWLKFFHVNDRVQQAVIKELNIDEDGTIRRGKAECKVVFKSDKKIEYAGKVSHIINHDNSSSIITHDIRIVESGEYSGNGKVINTIPANQEIYNQIKKIKYTSRVAIEGYEISRMRCGDRFTLNLGWHTLYITLVEIL